jgi:hypothetical protein
MSILIFNIYKMLWHTICVLNSNGKIANRPNRLCLRTPGSLSAPNDIGGKLLQIMRNSRGGRFWRVALQRGGISAMTWVIAMEIAMENPLSKLT